jgi:circadian clock protein KaiB
VGGDVAADGTPGAPPVYVLRLFLAGASARSSRALRNLRAVCDEHLPGRYELEVIDVYQEPERTRLAQVVAVPTLIKELPEPVRRLVGDMSRVEQVLIGLDIELAHPPDGE